MTADAVDLNSLWSLDAEILSKMAVVLGLPADAERLHAEHLEMNRRINAIALERRVRALLHAAME